MKTAQEVLESKLPKNRDVFPYCEVLEAMQDFATLHAHKISRNKISRHYKSFFGLENMGLGENDNLMIDWGESLVNDFCNQEVEKRIAERMPSKIELVKEYPTGYAQLCLLFKWDFYKLSEFEKDILRQISDGNKKRVDVYEEVRSRLTCSEKPNNSEQQMWRDIQEGERELPE